MALTQTVNAVFEMYLHLSILNNNNIFLFLLLVSQASWIVYFTESALEEENGGIVKHTITTHSKTVRELKHVSTLRKFQSMPHIMRSFFSSNDGYCSDDGKSVIVVQWCVSLNYHLL